MAVWEPGRADEGADQPRCCFAFDRRPPQASFQSAVSGIVSRQKILMDEYHVAVGLSWAVQTETASSMLELIRCLDTDGSAFCEPAVADARAVIHETLRGERCSLLRP